MKPTLDRMVDLVVSALSGKAKAFYDLEFDFFNEVTSISGKLKPFIKKSKPEKKVSVRFSGSDCVRLLNVLLPIGRPRSTRRWLKSTSRLECIFHLIQTVSLWTLTRSLVDPCKATQRYARKIFHLKTRAHKLWCRRLPLWLPSRSAKKELNTEPREKMKPLNRLTLRTNLEARKCNTRCGKRPSSKWETTVDRTYWLSRSSLCSRTCS